MAPIDRGTPFQETATHATSAVATHAAVAGLQYFVTDIEVSSDKSGSICLVKQGTTVILQTQVNATYFAHSFKVPLRGAPGALVSVEIDGTSVCKANMQGFEV